MIAPLAMEDIKSRRSPKNTLPIEQEQPAESGDSMKEIEIAQINSVENPAEAENNNA